MRRSIAFTAAFLVCLALSAQPVRVRFGWDKSADACGAALFGYWTSLDDDVRGMAEGNGICFEYNLKGFVFMGGAHFAGEIDHVLLGPTLNFKFDLGESTLHIPVTPLGGVSRMSRFDETTYDYGVSVGLLWRLPKRFGPGLSFRITRHTMGFSLAVTI